MSMAENRKRSEGLLGHAHWRRPCGPTGFSPTLLRIGVPAVVITMDDTDRIERLA